MHRESRKLSQMLLTVKEASERLRASPSLVYGLCARGLLDHHRCGLGRGTIRITENALEAYLDRSKVTVKPRAQGLRKEQFNHLDADRMLSAWKRQGAV
jgi:excisionase family DNA binding protein